MFIAWVDNHIIVVYNDHILSREGFTVDFILNRINNDIAICDEGSYEYILSLRKRIEYILFILMGYLWNKNSSNMLSDDRLRIISSFDRMTIGDCVSAITSLDLNREVLSSGKAKSLITKYPNIRNVKIGHGYASGKELLETLSPFYNELMEKISFLNPDYSLILVEKRDKGSYYGIRIEPDGQKSRWACPEDAFINEECFPRTYILIDNKYYKLSPFVTLTRNGADIKEYTFSSLCDSLIGQIKLCPLFGDVQEENIVYNEFAKLCEEDEYRQVSANGTVMNNYDCNYSSYIDIGLTKDLISFLTKNKANVSATLWGHGGVGKTACIQNVCEQLFCAKEQVFSYIVFVTAKDRIYNPATGKIVKNDSKYVRRYQEIIEIIQQTVFPDMTKRTDEKDIAELEELIRTYSGKMLIVIDDYETFLDDEKVKITNFIKSLDINHHKIVITTRNLRLSIGTPFSTSEFDTDKTCRFFEEIIKQKCPSLSDNLVREIKDTTVRNAIQKATSGRPIFIYQFAYLYMQKGMQKTMFSALYKGADAQNFLYGRVYEYLTPSAKLVFATIPAIINDDLLFRFDMLRYVMQKEITDSDKFESSVDELADQLIIERYTDSQGRVYAQELMNAMQDQYSKLESSYREAIRRLLESLGGKDISGSIEEAMLHEADQSRVSGNTAEIVGKYRRVLNLKDCTIKIKKQALLNVTSYLCVNDLNPKGASDLMSEYFRDFKDDPQIAYQYIVYLWQQDERKKDTINFIKEYFSRAEGHKKTSSQYLQLFALGTSYCSYYDMYVQEYTSVEKRKVQLSQTLNEFGRELFTATKANFDTLRSGVKHVVQMALVQTAKLCCEFDINDISKLQYGLEICDFASDHFIQFFLNQLKSTREKIEIKIGRPKWWSDFIQEDYHLGDKIEGVVKSIKPYGVFIKFGKSYSGLLHISKVSNHYIPSEELESMFKIDSKISAFICSIDKVQMRVNFSLIN